MIGLFERKDVDFLVCRQAHHRCLIRALAVVWGGENRYAHQFISTVVPVVKLEPALLELVSAHQRPQVVLVKQSFQRFAAKVV